MFLKEEDIVFIKGDGTPFYFVCVFFFYFCCLPLFLLLKLYAADLAYGFWTTLFKGEILCLHHLGSDEAYTIGEICHICGCKQIPKDVGGLQMIGPTKTGYSLILTRLCALVT